MVSLIGVGDNTVDTYIHQRMRYPGGNAVNVAVLAHRYGASPAAYLGWLGRDSNGSLVLDALHQEGLDLSHCRLVDGPNSYSTVELVDGDRVFGPGDNGVNALIQLTRDDYAYIHTFDVVHTSVFSHLESDLPALKQASHCLSFDFSQERDPAYLAKVLPYIDIALVSCSDLSLAEQEDFMRRTQAAGPRLVLVTRGGEGSWVYDGQQLYHQEIVPTQVIDTLGAGDAFAACFLVKWAAGETIPTAMQLAAQSAAENCTHFGAFGYAQPM
jgi:fructoselysine 6-kinase